MFSHAVIKITDGVHSKQMYTLNAQRVYTINFLGNRMYTMYLLKIQKVYGICPLYPPLHP